MDPCMNIAEYMFHSIQIRLHYADKYYFSHIIIAIESVVWVFNLEEEKRTYHDFRKSPSLMLPNEIGWDKKK